MYITYILYVPSIRISLDSTRSFYSNGGFTPFRVHERQGKNTREIVTVYVIWIIETKAHAAHVIYHMGIIWMEVDVRCFFVSVLPVAKNLAEIQFALIFFGEMFVCVWMVEYGALLEQNTYASVLIFNHPDNDWE